MLIEGFLRESFILICVYSFDVRFYIPSYLEKSNVPLRVQGVKGRVPCGPVQYDAKPFSGLFESG